jgi:hypothetical protein
MAMVEADIPDLLAVKGFFYGGMEKVDPYQGDLDGLPPTPVGPVTEEELEAILG